MHAENLLLLIDEFDELTVVGRDLLTLRALPVALFVLLAVFLGVHTGSVALAACALIGGTMAATLVLTVLDAVPAPAVSRPLEREPA